MKHLLILLSLAILFTSTHSFSKATTEIKVQEKAKVRTIEIKAEFDVSTESEDISDDDARTQGWVISENDYGDKVYILVATVLSTDLPLSKRLGSADLSISKTGALSVGMSVGDYDADASAQLQLPKDPITKILLPLPQITLNVSGGDHASGAWSFGGTVTVKVY